MESKGQRYPSLIEARGELAKYNKIIQNPNKSDNERKAAYNMAKAIDKYIMRIEQDITFARNKLCWFFNKEGGSCFKGDYCIGLHIVANNTKEEVTKETKETKERTWGDKKYEDELKKAINESKKLAEEQKKLEEHMLWLYAEKKKKEEEDKKEKVKKEIYKTARLYSIDEFKKVIDSKFRELSKNMHPDKKEEEKKVEGHIQFTSLTEVHKEMLNKLEEIKKQIN